MKISTITHMIWTFCSLVSKDSVPKMYYLEWVSENGSLQLVSVVRCSLSPDPEVGVWTRPVVLKG
jgi:hypothetical protein